MKAGFRIALVVALTSAMLVPELMMPVRAITRPATLSARYEFGARAGAGSLHMELAATHAMFSWSGEEGSGVRYRYLDGGELTDWRRAPESHDMENGNRHYSSPLLLDRSRNIEWEALEGAERVTIDYVNTLDGPRRRMTVPATADALASEPNIVTRAEWGADESLKRTSGGCTRTFYRPRQLFVHHTVTSNHDPNPAATVRAIYHFHTEGRGWCDIGYNFLVSGDGQIFEGRWARPYAPWETHDGEDTRDRIATGAHTESFNSGSIGISVLGNYQTASPRRPAKRKLVSLLAWEADRHGLNPTGWHRYRNPSSGESKRLPYIAGHRDAGQTSCPGERLYRALPSIRRSVARKVGPGKGESILEPKRTSPITVGEKAVARFRLTSRAGAPLSDRRVSFYKKGEGRWVFTGRARTNERGWARLVLTPKRNLRLAAVWSGSDRRWGSDALSGQRVRPTITIEPEGGAQTGPDSYRFQQGTSAIFFGGRVGPKHVGRKVIIRTWVKQADATYLRMPDRSKRLDDTSAYRAKLEVPPEGGTFKLVTTLEPHDDHIFGRSRSIEVTVPAPIIPP